MAASSQYAQSSQIRSNPLPKCLTIERISGTIKMNESFQPLSPPELPLSPALRWGGCERESQSIALNTTPYIPVQCYFRTGRRCSACGRSITPVTWARLPVAMTVVRHGVACSRFLPTGCRNPAYKVFHLYRDHSGKSKTS